MRGRAVRGSFPWYSCGNLARRPNVLHAFMKKLPGPGRTGESQKTTWGRSRRGSVLDDYPPRAAVMAANIAVS